jgi:thiol:disulfide interchange protein
LGLPFLLGVGMGLPWPFAGAGLSVLPKPGKFMVYIKYAFGVIILAAGIWYLFTGWSLLPGKYDAQKEFIRLEDALKRAEADGKPVLIDFWATWCKNCKAMEKNVFTKPEVKRELARFEVVKFQAEKPNDPAVSALLKKWDIAGLPAFVILKKAD